MGAAAAASPVAACLRYGDRRVRARARVVRVRACAACRRGGGRRVSEWVGVRVVSFELYKTRNLKQ